MDKKKILFLTGTRADFGKLKPLIESVAAEPNLDAYIFATGMHTLAKYGRTINEIYKCGYKHVFEHMNQRVGDPMDLVLASTIDGLSRYMHESPPDMLVIHGDRVEALAGSIVGALNNIYVAHIEGGEVSGTIDESIRHAVSKLSHMHFVANDEAKNRLRQLGEDENSIFVIGSPDIDVMLSDQLPGLSDVKDRYAIGFEDYAIVMFHPVTTEVSSLKTQVKCLVDALIESKRKYVVIYPNNDAGCEIILEEYQRLTPLKNFKIFPSLRFEWFLTLLKHADFIIGNSSAGVREAPVYAVPTIDIGTRQRNRFMHDTIVNIECKEDEILAAIKNTARLGTSAPSMHFGTGNSAQLFHNTLLSETTWATSKQKSFRDASYSFHPNEKDKTPHATTGN